MLWREGCPPTTHTTPSNSWTSAGCRGIQVSSDATRKQHQIPQVKSSVPQDCLSPPTPHFRLQTRGKPQDVTCASTKWLQHSQNPGKQLLHFNSQVKRYRWQGLGGKGWSFPALSRHFAAPHLQAFTNWEGLQAFGVLERFRYTVMVD